MSLALSTVLLAVTGAAPPAAAWQTAPPSLPIPPPPPANPPAGYTSAVSERARIHVEPGTEIDAAAFTRAWGLLLDDGIHQLESFLPSLTDQIDVYVYVSDASFAAATANTRWPEPETADVPGQSRRGRYRGQSGRLRPPHAAGSGECAAPRPVACRGPRSLAWPHPRGFDEGLAAYFERPAPARLARHAALVQNARAGGDLLSWSDLNRPAPPDVPPPGRGRAHAYSMVAFLIDRHGPRVLGEFVAKLGEEPDWRAVLRETYSRAPDELEAQWEENPPALDGGRLAHQPAGGVRSAAGARSASSWGTTPPRAASWSNRCASSPISMMTKGSRRSMSCCGRPTPACRPRLFMTQAQAALEQHDYDRAQSLLEQARRQYGHLSDAQEPTELLASYETLAQAGMQAGDDLDRARQRSARWADYPTARAAALAPAPGTRAWATMTA